MITIIIFSTVRQSNVCNKIQFPLQKHKEELHTAKISLIIVALFMTCWMPFHVINLLMRVQLTNVTGKSLSEAFILTSTNPQYYKIFKALERLLSSNLSSALKIVFIDIWFTSSINENYKLRTWGEHVLCINCSECQNKTKQKNCVHNMFSPCSELLVFM